VINFGLKIGVELSFASSVRIASAISAATSLAGFERSSFARVTLFMIDNSPSSLSRTTSNPSGTCS